MPETRVGGMLALLAGSVSCIGIVLVFPFAANLVRVWHGHPDRLPTTLGFGIPLAVCLALAVTSLAFRSERPGSATPGTLALTLIGLQLLVFLPAISFFSSGST